RNEGNVSYHFLTWRVGTEVPAHQVRDRPSRALLGRGRPPGPWLAGHQTQLAHQCPDQLPTRLYAPAGELGGHATVPVRAVGILECLRDQNLEFFSAFR